MGHRDAFSPSRNSCAIASSLSFPSPLLTSSYVSMMMAINLRGTMERGRARESEQRASERSRDERESERARDEGRGRARPGGEGGLLVRGRNIAQRHTRQSRLTLVSHYIFALSPQPSTPRPCVALHICESTAPSHSGLFH